MKQSELTPEFVEFVPTEIEDGVIYISMAYGTAVHRCCCGCGEKVVTPFSPTDWKLIFDGDSVSLHPSIGNWSYRCRSHYWIRQNRIHWAGRMSQAQIDAGRAHDWFVKENYFKTHEAVEAVVGDGEKGTGGAGIRSRLANWWSGLWR